MEPICFMCAQVIRENPGVCPIKLFPKGRPDKVEVLVNGTGYCQGHMPHPGEDLSGKE